MPVLRNVKREKIAQGVAKGLSGAEAYRQAGYRGQGHVAEAGASEILSNPEVKTRVAELQGRAAEKATKTTASLIRDLDDAIVFARQCENPSAIVQAITLQARLLGLLVEKRAIDVVMHKPSLTPMAAALELTVEEWQAQFVKPHTVEHLPPPGGE
ncbi:Terminase small subunit [Rhizobiaceae sp. 2RAB30]